jgi:hypothetical protein
MSARALFVVDRWGRIRFSRAYPDFFNPGVDDLLTTLGALAAEDAEEATRANAISHAEDTEHAEPTEDARARGPTRGDTSPPVPAEARETLGDGKRDANGTG